MGEKPKLTKTQAAAKSGVSEMKRLLLLASLFASISAAQFLVPILAGGASSSGFAHYVSATIAGGSIASGTYVGGIASATGAAGSLCGLTFSGGAMMYVPLPATNTVPTSGTALQFNGATTAGAAGAGYTTAPTSATIGAGPGATCTGGTATVSTTLTSISNYPLLLSLSNSTLATVANGGTVQHTVATQSGGNAILIPADFTFGTNSSCTSAIPNFEFEAYSATAGTALVWVQVPTVAYNQTIYACWGNAAISTQQGSVSGTWPTGTFSLVSHLGTTSGSAVSAVDSTANGNNGTLHGSPTVGTGEDDGAIALTSSSSEYNQYSETAGLPCFNTTGYGYEFWVSGSSGQTGGSTVLAEGNSSTASPFIYFETSGANLQLLFRNNAGTSMLGPAPSLGTVFNGTLKHIVWSDAGGVAALYINGVQDTGNFNYTQSGTTTLNTLAIGALVRTTVADYFSGTVDEFRCLEIAPTATEVAVDYANQSAPGTYWNVTYH